MSNHLLGQTSPYLLQHAENPVDWYPWDAKAFETAKKQDKPIFLSIGYSTCHWCHVMAHESFEDAEIAQILNKYFISIKVDKEERPDIDSIYMSVCQALTGSGGWPMSIFMTAQQKPFFAGTYFPKTARHGSVGLKEILLTINEKWQSDRNALLRSADEIVLLLNKPSSAPADATEALLDQAAVLYRQSYDNQWGGFGDAPKFPAPHNHLFLMQRYTRNGDNDAKEMAEKTLLQMYRGGIFDHIGYGFCRYSTDRYFLVPHFEKMLYDNALLILAYTKAFEVTKKPIYKKIAKKTAYYILSEMQSDEGGFYSAQDADSDGEEGKYYVFTPQEIIAVLNEKDGNAFNAHYGILQAGNFEGKSIPNLLHTTEFTDRYDECLPKLRDYRRKRTKLRTDDKILTAWNSLMIAALCSLYRISQNDEYLTAAKKAMGFIEEHLSDDDVLFVSCRNGKKSQNGFLDDYASYIYALLAMYEVTFDNNLLQRAHHLTAKTINDFFDAKNGGFYLSGKENESLILSPKESYDGAIPSGNSLMAYNLVRLCYLFPNEQTTEVLEKQMNFMAGEAKKHPAGYAMFLTALSDYLDPPTMITVVKGTDDISDLPFHVSSDTFVRVLDAPACEYPMMNENTTFYVCKNHSCMPPMNKHGFYVQNSF